MFLRSVGFLDPRGLMGGRVKALTPIDVLTLSERQFSSKENPLAIESAKMDGNRIKIVRRNDNLRHHPKLSAILNEWYDPVSLMIVEQKFLRVDKKNSNEKSLSLTRNFAWEDRDGIQVLTRMRESMPVACKVGERTELGTRDTTYQIHWLKVNEEIDPGLFELERVAGDNAVSKVIKDAMAIAGWEIKK